MDVRTCGEYELLRLASERDEPNSDLCGWAHAWLGELQDRPMNDAEQLRRQNQSLIQTIEEMDLSILALNELIEIDRGGEAAYHWAKLVASAKARDTANHAGDLIAGGKV